MVKFDEKNIISQLDAMAQMYFRLIILAAPSGSGKTAFLKRLQSKLNIPYINVNFELSKRLLEYSHSQRRLKARETLEDILDAHSNTTVLLDNIEMMFSPELALEPLQLLKTLSRNRSIIAAWNGYIRNKHLVYAEPSHPEYREETIDDIIVIEL